MASEMEPIGVGIAGLGRSGWNIHARLLKDLAGKFKVVAASDELAERRQEAAATFGCATYESFDSLLADREVELVVIAVPSSLHADYAKKALRAGKKVVSEKPMATSLAAADEMLACAETEGQLFTVFQNRRYDRDFVAAKRVIDSGVLGRIVMVRIAQHAFKRRWDWQTLKEYGGGSLNNTCPHPIDQALTLMGGVTPSVTCLRDHTLTLGDADDHVKILLSAEGSPTVEIEVSDSVAYPQQHWLVVGTRGGLSGTPDHLDWKYVKAEEFPSRALDPHPTPDRSYNREQLKWHEGSWDSSSDRGPGHAGFYLDLYETLKGEKPLAIDPKIVRLQMWVMEECRRQAPV